MDKHQLGDVFSRDAVQESDVWGLYRCHGTVAPAHRFVVQTADGECLAVVCLSLADLLLDETLCLVAFAFFDLNCACCCGVRPEEVRCRWCVEHVSLGHVEGLAL